MIGTKPAPFLFGSSMARPGEDAPARARPALGRLVGLVLALGLSAALAAGLAGTLAPSLQAAVLLAGLAIVFFGMIAAAFGYLGEERGPPAGEAALALLEEEASPLLLTDRRGELILANAASRALLRLEGSPGETGSARLFAGEGAEGAALYRLMKAVRTGTPGAEQLTPRGGAAPLAVRVRPLGPAASIMLWRLEGAVPPAAGARAALLEGTIGDMLFARSPIAMIRIDAAGRILAANEAALRVLSPEAVGASLLGLLPEEHRPRLAERLDAAFAGQASQRLDAALLPGAEGGEPRGVEIVLAALPGQGLREAFAYLIDTGARRQLELQFVQSQKMQAIGQLAGGVAHDFNNLLTAIIGFCDLLLLRHQVGDPAFSDINQIRQNATRAANLTGQLLAFSRRQALQPRVLALEEILSDLTELLRRLLGEKVQLALKHGRELWPVRVDKIQFEQVVINLAVNARDAMPAGGRLEIRTRNVSAGEAKRFGHALLPSQDYVLIEVEDSGHGIAKEHLDKIFEPFFTTKPVGEGTGLGLSTVYGIVKQTGGYIFPASEPGRGTTFQIFLPRHADEAGALADRPAAGGAAAAPLSPDLTGMGTILLVEDEDAVRSFAARALESRGYHVLAADSGESALELVRARAGQPVDLIISDVTMPRMDGPTMVEEARKTMPGVRVVFISGYAEGAFRKALAEPSDFAFLPKPFTLKQLAAKVKEVLEAA